MVTGGNVVVVVSGPDADVVDWTVVVDGTVAEVAVHPDGLLVDGLAEGPSTIEVVVDGQVVSSVEVINHPITGPVFSGPHVMPFFCTFEDFGLEPASDSVDSSDCSAVTEVTW